MRQHCSCSSSVSYAGCNCETTQAEAGRNLSGEHICKACISIIFIIMQDAILKEHRQRLENAVEMGAKLQRNEETILRGKMDTVGLPSSPAQSSVDFCLVYCSIQHDLDSILCRGFFTSACALFSPTKSSVQSCKVFIKSCIFSCPALYDLYLLLHSHLSTPA